MDEIRNMIRDKTGITEEQAAQTVEIMATYIKQRVPHLMHSQLDKIFSGKSLEESIRDQVGDLGNEVKERTESLARDLKQAFDDAFKNKKE